MCEVIISTDWFATYHLEAKNKKTVTFLKTMACKLIKNTYFHLCAGFVFLSSVTQQFIGSQPSSQELIFVSHLILGIDGLIKAVKQ